ncbi:tetratricopeptide repeat protein [Stutzerimonas stutzeri]|uniref:tetratricopeptide repeat protein n=1 Tax=Stutzerimonas stutzeri TaxID=316 RepID=UPI001C2E1F33|nr:tetratricopeptide repeat protein [Stutzerimonas stutzeri]
MTCRDRYDLPLSTTSALAAERYQTGVDLLLSLWPGAAEVLEDAIAVDPDFALAHAARARLHAIRAEVTEARAKVAKALELVSTFATERERSHVATLYFALNGQAPKALESALVHLDQWPNDILIMSLPLGAFGLFAFSGMADHDQARVDLVEKHARHFGDDDWWFLNYRGWSHGENGNIELGRKLTQRSLEVRWNNANAAHANAHVLHEAGAHDEAGAFLQDWLPGYDRNGILHGHVAWHGALVALEAGDAERALAIYTDNVAPPVTTGVPVNVVSDTSSFLWRLQAYGHPVPAGLWEEAVAYSTPYFRQAGFAFADFHMALLAAATGDQPALEQRVAVLDEMVQSNALPAGSVVPTLCRAAHAFANEDYAACARLLEPVAADVARIGGSGAQREIVEDTLVVALMRAGETQKAHALIDKRLHRRPSRRDSRWLASVAGA